MIIISGMRKKKKLHVFLKYYRLKSDVLLMLHIMGKIYK